MSNLILLIISRVVILQNTRGELKFLEKVYNKKVSFDLTEIIFSDVKKYVNSLVEFTAN